MERPTSLSRRTFLTVFGLTALYHLRNQYQPSPTTATDSIDTEPDFPLPQIQGNVISESSYDIRGQDAAINAMVTLDVLNYRRLVLPPGSSYPLFDTPDGIDHLRNPNDLTTLGAVNYPDPNNPNHLGNEMCFGAVLIVDAMRKAQQALGLGQPAPATQNYHTEPMVEWWPHKDVHSYDDFLVKRPHYPPVGNHAAVYWENGQLVQDLILKNPPESNTSIALRAFAHRTSEAQVYRLTVQVLSAQQSAPPPFPQRRCIFQYDHQQFAHYLTQGPYIGPPDGSHPNAEYDFAIGTIAAGEQDPVSTKGQLLVAPCEGTVIATDESYSTGKYLKFQDVEGNVWYVGHLDAQLGAPGKKLKAGSLIGIMGDTGYYEYTPGVISQVGPHVHLQSLDPSGRYREIEEYAWAVDPANII